MTTTASSHVRHDGHAAEDSEHGTGGAPTARSALVARISSAFSATRAPLEPGTHRAKGESIAGIDEKGSGEPPIG